MPHEQPYEHQEYPKWMTGHSGNQEVVNDEAGELKFLEEHGSEDEAPAAAPDDGAEVAADDGEAAPEDEAAADDGPGNEPDTSESVEASEG